MLQVLSEKHSGHSTFTDLTLDDVAAFERGVQAIDRFEHEMS